MVDIDYDVVKTVRELQKGGSNDRVIEQKLGELGYNDTESAEIMRLAAGVDTAEKEGKSKKLLIFVVGAFVLVVVFMAVCAVLFS